MTSPQEARPIVKDAGGSYYTKAFLTKTEILGSGWFA
jgi:hypothetical protein